MSAGEGYARHFMDMLLPEAERTGENLRRVTAWLEEHAEADGFITERSETCYGRLLWDVRVRSAAHGALRRAAVMTRHLFFTGEKGVGKSTLVELLLRRARGRVGGFRTKRVESLREGEATVHLLRADTGEQPCEGNLLFSCAAPQPDMERRFEVLGRAALRGSAGCELVLMDELGPHEAGATDFPARGSGGAGRAGARPGVLQRAELDFLEGIAGREDVLVREVTRENRDGLAETLSALPEMAGGELMGAALRALSGG